jgi:hypothetical protein
METPDVQIALPTAPFSVVTIASMPGWPLLVKTWWALTDLMVVADILLPHLP